jgi:putative addiction module component (TIGR02574 family)
MLTIPLDQLERELVQLPRATRERLSTALAGSLDCEDDPGWDEAWDKELGRRIEAYRRGEIWSIPWEETIIQLRAMLKK